MVKQCMSVAEDLVVILDAFFLSYHSHPAQVIASATIYMLNPINPSFTMTKPGLFVLGQLQ